MASNLEILKMLEAGEITPAEAEELLEALEEEEAEGENVDDLEDLEDELDEDMTDEAENTSSEKNDSREKHRSHKSDRNIVIDVSKILSDSMAATGDALQAAQDTLAMLKLNIKHDGVTVNVDFDQTDDFQSRKERN